MTLIFLCLAAVLSGCYGSRPPDPNRCVQFSPDGREVEERVERTMSQRPRRIFYVYRDSINDNWIQHGKDVTYFVTGSVKYEENYFDGKKHGAVESWFEKGGKQGELHYTHGKIDGKSLTWWSNGIKRSEKNWNMGVLNGSAIQWNDYGVKRSEIIWAKNKIVQRFKYDDDGKLIPSFK